jgi:hypothetical protein
MERETTIIGTTNHTQKIYKKGCLDHVHHDIVGAPCSTWQDGPPHQLKRPDVLIP